MQALKIQALKFTYPDGNTVIDHLDLEVDLCERIGLIGANGAGKSTLLLLLMGMLQAEQGEIILGQLPMNKKNIAEIRKKAGFVFQNADDQLFMNSVYEDLAFGPRNYGMNEEQVKLQVEGVLEAMGILHLRDRAPSKLSGGEKRLAAIGSALTLKPEILLMDEPSTGLDPRARRRLIEWIKDYNQTLVITSHDLDLIYETCDRVIILNEGKILASGDPLEILSSEELLNISGLEVPSTLKPCSVCGHKVGRKSI